MIVNRAYDERQPARPRHRRSSRDSTIASVPRWHRRASWAAIWCAGAGAGLLIAATTPRLASVPVAFGLGVLGAGVVLSALVAVAVLLIEALVADPDGRDDDGAVRLRVRDVRVTLRPIDGGRRP